MIKSKISNPVINCNMPPYPEECILRANRDGAISDDFTKSRAYEVGYRINPMQVGLHVMTYSKFGDEIFEFGSTGFDAPEGAIRSNYQEYKNYLDNLVIEQKLFGSQDNTPNPADDFIDAVVPQTLRDPLINLPYSFPTNPPFLPPPRNESFIAPMPFFETEEKPNLLIPTLLGIALIGYFILK